MAKAVQKTAKRTVKKRTPTRKNSTQLFPIVGIGASAGGLEAFIELFSKIPDDTGMAFVLVQHLEPNHPSMSAGIIAKSTALRVEEVRDGTRIKPNHIYVIPPNHNMQISKGVLKLLPSSKLLGPRLTIDYFFDSLAEEEKSRVIGIVLSGTGSDGTSGLRKIKAEGGVTFAQDPASAKYSFMPQNAITAGVVDLVLSPANIAKELTVMAKNPYLKTKVPPDVEESEIPEVVNDKSLHYIFRLQ